MVAADAFKRSGSTNGPELMKAIRETNIADHIIIGPPIKFDEKGQNIRYSVGLGAEPQPNADGRAASRGCNDEPNVADAALAGPDLSNLFMKAKRTTLTRGELVGHRRDAAHLKSPGDNILALVHTFSNLIGQDLLRLTRVAASFVDPPVAYSPHACAPSWRDGGGHHRPLGAATNERQPSHSRTNAVWLDRPAHRIERSSQSGAFSNP